MPEYLHPGVYVEETSFRAKPIEGVSTSTAGLVGRTRKGREGRPTLVTSFADFVREFGAPYSPPVGLGDYLGHALRAFFENGGLRAYIVRVLGANSQAATSVDPATATNLVGFGTVLRLAPNATVIGPTRTLALDSLRTVGNNTNLEIWTRSTATSGPTLRHTVQVQSYDATRNTVTLMADLPVGTVLNASSTFVHVVGTAPHNGTHLDGPVVRARSRGAGGNDVAVEFRPRELPPVRLATRRYQRDRPIIASFTTALPGPAAVGAVSMTLAGADARRLRSGDTFLFGGNATLRTVGAVAVGTVDTNAPTNPQSYGTGAMVRIVTRAAITPPVPVEVYVLGAGETFDLSAAAGGTVASVPHGVVAAVAVNDVIEVQLGANTTRATITAAPSPNVAVAFAPALVAGEDFSTGTVQLVDTASQAGAHTTRLVIGDLVGLVAPFGAGPTFSQPIGVNAGTAIDLSSLLMVDPNTNQVIVERTQPPVPASGDFPDGATNGSWTSFELLRVVAANGDTFRVGSASGFYVGAIVEVDTGTAKHGRIVQSVDSANRTIRLTTTLPADIDVVASAAQRRATVRVLELDALVYERSATSTPTLKETFTNLTWNPSVSGKFYITQINDPDNGSKLVTLSDAAAPPAPMTNNAPVTDEGFWAYLVDGVDGDPLTAVDLVGSDNGPNQRFGIQALAERKDIALVAVPGVTDELVQQQLITHCELLKYRFAILDGRMNQPVVTDVVAHRNNYDSKYAAYYAPWLETVDLATGNSLLVPPSGHVLGICARSDNERGVHKAPANETVRGITDVELPYTDGEQDVLNPCGVNLIREFEGRGIRLWGARTLSSDPEWKYVNVRRLFIFLEHSIDNSTQWVVFEPNNEALWARVKATIESFLFAQWKTGAFMGTKPEDAYFVRCDRTTMTQDDLDNGRLVCLIGVAPTYPAEFVIFRIGQFTASSNLA